MVYIDAVTSFQLSAIDEWIGDVFDKDTRLHDLLEEAELTHAEIEQLKAYHLPAFLQAMVNLIANDHPRNEPMIRHYGLRDGNPEDFYAIAPSFGVSGNRIRQLVAMRRRVFQTPEHKAKLRQALMVIARDLLNDQASD